MKGDRRQQRCKEAELCDHVTKTRCTLNMLFSLQDGGPDTRTPLRNQFTSLPSPSKCPGFPQGALSHSNPGIHTTMSIFLMSRISISTGWWPFIQLSSRGFLPPGDCRHHVYRCSPFQLCHQNAAFHRCQVRSHVLSGWRKEGPHHPEPFLCFWPQLKWVESNYPQVWIDRAERKIRKKGDTNADHHWTSSSFRKF